MNTVMMASSSQNITMPLETPTRPLSTLLRHATTIRRRRTATTLTTVKILLSAFINHSTFTEHSVSNQFKTLPTSPVVWYLDLQHIAIQQYY
jgi:hypothetical protein